MTQSMTVFVRRRPVSMTSTIDVKNVLVLSVRIVSWRTVALVNPLPLLIPLRALLLLRLSQMPQRRQSRKLKPKLHSRSQKRMQFKIC